MDYICPHCSMSNGDSELQVMQCLQCGGLFDKGGVTTVADAPPRKAFTRPCPKCQASLSFNDPQGAIHCDGCGNFARVMVYLEMDGLELPSKYHRRVKGVVLDYYDIVEAWGVVHSAISHAFKKLMRYGCGDKPLAKDVSEAIWSLRRWQQMQTPKDPQNP